MTEKEKMLLEQIYNPNCDNELIIVIKNIFIIQ